MTTVITIQRTCSRLVHRINMAHLSWLRGHETDGPLRSSLRRRYGAKYNMLKLKSIGGALGVLFTIILSNYVVTAQSTLFNIPSTDVVAEKKVYLEFDFISHLESHQNGGFQSYVPRVVYGAAKHLEIGANVSLTDALAPNQPVEFQPNAKYQFYSN